MSSDFCAQLMAKIAQTGKKKPANVAPATQKTTSSLIIAPVFLRDVIDLRLTQGRHEGLVTRVKYLKLFK